MALDATFLRGISHGKIVAGNIREDDIQQLYRVLSGATGRATLVPALADRQIQVMQFVYSTSTLLILTLESLTGSTYTTICPMLFIANGALFRQAVSPQQPLFAASAGEALVVNQSTTPTVAHLYIHWRYSPLQV
jgi:hypothetical protein